MSELPDGCMCLQNPHITCLFPAPVRIQVETFFPKIHTKQICICGLHDRGCDAVGKHLGRGNLILGFWREKQILNYSLSYERFFNQNNQQNKSIFEKGNCTYLLKNYLLTFILIKSQGI